MSKFTGATRAAGLLLAFAMLAGLPGRALADPCSDSYGNAVPGCQQVDVTIDLKAWETKGWALYCPSNANYYWGGYSDSWSHSPHIFWEDPFEESQSKADFTASNTRLGHNSVTITIGCSPINPNGSCSGGRTIAGDPGCGQTNQRQVCAGDGENQQCWLEWDEECVAGNGTVTDWACTQALYATMCTAC